MNNEIHDGKLLQTDELMDNNEMHDGKLLQTDEFLDRGEDV